MVPRVVWLIGYKGMLGTELSRVLEKKGIPFIGTDREIDITDSAALASFAETQAPITWIVNCAAYTAVDRAEDDVETCRRLNTEGAGNIAAAARNAGARLIHLSTDYVFNGKGIPGEGGFRPYREDDRTDPIGVYGLTKRDGERAVLENNPASWIVRTAWLYGAYGNNFVATMLRLMKERDEVKVVNDQRGSPTWAFDLAGAICALMDGADKGPGKAVSPGIYHYTNEGNITWFDFAGEIYRRGRALGLLSKDCAVKPCTSAEFPAKVKRPAWSVLDKGKIKTTLGIEIPAWDKSLGNFLELL
jgi:dTDP-4-dehydrorhamnose reductase